MSYDFSLSIAQLSSLAAWVDDSPGSADVLLARVTDDGLIQVGQGDARCMIALDGTLRELD